VQEKRINRTVDIQRIFSISKLNVMPNLITSSNTALLTRSLQLNVDVCQAIIIDGNTLVDTIDPGLVVVSHSHLQITHHHINVCFKSIINYCTQLLNV